MFISLTYILRDTDGKLYRRQEIEDMMDGGLLYSTIDLDHFKMID
jgi:hypothetical protein